MKLRGLILLTLIALVLALQPSGSWLPVNAAPSAPPPDNPLARGEHPRLFITTDELPELRARLSRHYRTELQAFIALLDDTSGFKRRQRNIEAHWGSLNYAFLAVLDPARLQAEGFRFKADLDTPEEYCATAFTHASKLLPHITANKGQNHGAFETGYPNPTYFPVIAAYDWCYPHWGESQKRAVVDAFVAAHNKTWAGLDPLIAHGRDGMLANNQDSADIHDTLGILGFYRDPYPDPAVQASLYEVFHTVWFERVLAELNHFYGPGTFWHEGSGGYLKEGMLNLGVPFALMSSALGRNFFSTVPFFAEYPAFLAANLKPHGQLAQCGSGSARCPQYLERWGVVGQGISDIGCRDVLLTAGMLRRGDHVYAPLAKWLYENAYGRRSCEDQMWDYEGVWSSSVLYRFLLGDRDIPARSPPDVGLAATQKLGLGQYVMRSSYETEATQVIFWATPWSMYGHRPKTEGGHFTLHKFGNLILTPVNGKSGEAVTEGLGGRNLARNIIGVHKGASDPTHDFDDTSRLDPFWEARGISQIHIVGELMAESVGDGIFDYVAYDNSVAWSKTADVSQREFVYLRGPTDSEYLVVLDRMSVRRSQTDEKIWKIWVPAQPEFVTGATENPRPGKWVAPGADTIRMVNRRSSLATDKFESAPTHGVFFLKALWPERVEMKVLGGPGVEYQSGDDDGTTPFGRPQMSPGMHEYLGWGRIEVQPAVARAYDVFLNVIQFGDADTLTTMAPVARIRSEDGVLLGAHVQDPRNEWVMLFAREASSIGRIKSLDYTVRQKAGRTRHLLVDLAPSTVFHATVAARGPDLMIALSETPRPRSVRAPSSDQGVLWFTVEGTRILPGADAAPTR